MARKIITWLESTIPQRAFVPSLSLVPGHSVDSPEKAKYIEAEGKLGDQLKEARGSLAHWTAHHENSKLTTELGLPPSSLSALERKSAPAALDSTTTTFDAKRPVKREGGSNQLNAARKSIAHWTAHHENSKSTAELELPPSYASVLDTKSSAPASWRPTRTVDAERRAADGVKGERVGGDTSAHSWRLRKISTDSVEDEEAPEVSLPAEGGVGTSHLEPLSASMKGGAEGEARADRGVLASKPPSETSLPCYVHLCPCVGGSGSGT